MGTWVFWVVTGTQEQIQLPILRFWLRQNDGGFASDGDYAVGGVGAGRRVATVISGGQFRRKGTPTVPMPRLT